MSQKVRSAAPKRIGIAWINRRIVKTNMLFLRKHT